MLPTPSGLPRGRKRSRDVDHDDVAQGAQPYEKKARPTIASAPEQQPWHNNAVPNPPDDSQAYQHNGYDSDSHSSMVSEAGSHQEDMNMSDDDDNDDDDDDDDDDEQMDASTFSTASPEQQNHQQQQQQQHPSTPQDLWRTRIQGNRVATPILPPRPGARPLQQTYPNTVRQHIRSRHPQENLSSETGGRPEIPSPIDEDEVPTPPSASAAEAAGSQLSMLSVNDMDMDDAGPEFGDLHVDRSRSGGGGGGAGDEAVTSATGPEVVRVRKQRQRSGAMSGGENSPARGGGGLEGAFGGAVARRGFSMGFRSDCEKCRLRVPGHMNHFIA